MLEIPYQLREYEVDPNDLSAEAVAAKVNMLLAAAAGDRACSLVPLKEVQPLTGYIRVGVTELGAKKSFRAFIDAAALKLPTLRVSGGMRGLQILISPADYIRATRCTLVENLGRS